jgi:hypothetical protein
MMIVRLMKPMRSGVGTAAHFPGTKLVAKAQALLLTGSAKWSAKYI